MITLYKKGNTHTVRGVVCELKNFQIHELDHALSLGYVKAPSDLIEKPELSNKEIRLAAKRAKIEDYDSKLIKTLKKELGYED